VDVWIIFWVDVFQFWMKCCIAFAGQAGIAFVDLDEWIPFVEVDVVVVSRELGESVLVSGLWCRTVSSA
jgi:hypothetical protein